MPSSNAAPKPPTSSGATISATQKLPVICDRRIADIGAQHEERAMREVDDAHDAEDQRESDAEEEQQRCLRQRVEALRDEEARGSPSAASGCGRTWRLHQLSNVICRQAGVTSSPGKVAIISGIGVL